MRSGQQSRFLLLPVGGKLILYDSLDVNTTVSNSEDFFSESF